MASRDLLSLFLISVTCICVARIEIVSACSGCVQLTEYTFDKLLSKFDVSLVKFDVAFPYGDKHEAYSELAKDAKSIDELLVAEVGIKDYGERDNEAIAKRFSITKDNFPVVKLFLKGKSEPYTFPSEKAFTTDSLRHFVKQNAGIHLSLPGCLPQFDNIAFQFMKAKPDAKKTLLKKAETLIDQLNDTNKAIGKTYVQIMKKVLDKKDGFIVSENERVKKLLESKTSPEKKKELNNKLNILLSFSEKVVGEKNAKDEF